MDEPEDLTPLDPAYVRVLQIDAAIMGLIMLVCALIIEAFAPVPRGSFIGPVLLLALWLVFVVSPRKYRHWGYRLSPDRLQIARGYLFHSDTVVPLGRVQHLDVQQGPLMRKFGLSTLTVQTAGTANASVGLPGLKHEDALAMRETIRARIKAAQT